MYNKHAKINRINVFVSMISYIIVSGNCKNLRKVKICLLFDIRIKFFITNMISLFCMLLLFVDKERSKRIVKQNISDL